MLLSSAIGDVDIEVDGAYIDVTLTASGNTELLHERYYAYTGSVTLYDLGTLIEDNMRISNAATADFTLRVFSDTIDNKADSWVIHVLYCDRFTANADVSVFLKENFLTTLSVRRVTANSTSSLFFYAEKGESIAYTVAHTFRKYGSEAIYKHEYYMDSGKTATSSGVVQINIAQNAIIADAAGFALVRPSEIELVTFCVSVGQRSITFFIDTLLDERETFYFRNCFNVWDWAALPIVTTAKTDVDRSLAVINGTSRFYNQATEKIYEVEAKPLTSDEAEWIDQLFSSRDVFRIEPDATNPDDPLVIVPILITDCTCEMQDGDEKPNSIKFKWRYANNRPIVHLPASSGIFTSPFNPVYS
jgi:hypothetical protein